MGLESLAGRGVAPHAPHTWHGVTTVRGERARKGVGCVCPGEGKSGKGVQGAWEGVGAAPWRQQARGFR